MVPERRRKYVEVGPVLERGVKSIIEATAAQPNFNWLLSPIVESYYKCGGDLVGGFDFPLHHAVWSGNSEGIKIIMKAWEKLERAAKL